MTCDGQVGDLTRLVVVQGPGAQPLSTEALALHVVVNVSRASPLLLHLSEFEKDGITPASAFSRGQIKLGAETQALDTGVLGPDTCSTALVSRQRTTARSSGHLNVNQAGALAHTS